MVSFLALERRWKSYSLQTLVCQSGTTTVLASQAELSRACCTHETSMNSNGILSTSSTTSEA